MAFAVIRRLLLLVLLALLAVPATAGAADLGDEIVVRRAGGLTATERERADVTREGRLPIPGVELVSADGSRADALEALRADPDVAWAEPNRPVHASAEPLANLLWGLRNTSQSVWGVRGRIDADVDAPEAWAATRGTGAIVAVVDSGIDVGHPDLASRLVAGVDYVDGDSDPTDEHGHGTHVAGTIAAAENGTGVVGVAPDARIMPLRVLGPDGSGRSSDVASAFAYAGDHGARIVNASLGGSTLSRAQETAIRAHPGTLYVVAAGNGGTDGVGTTTTVPRPSTPVRSTRRTSSAWGRRTPTTGAPGSPTTAPAASTSSRRE